MKKELSKQVLESIIEDESEYCFDKDYINDEQWVSFFLEETREERLNDLIKFWKDLFEKDVDRFIIEVVDVYDDKYDYIFNKEID